MRMFWGTPCSSSSGKLFMRSSFWGNMRSILLPWNSDGTRHVEWTSKGGVKELTRNSSNGSLFMRRTCGGASLKPRFSDEHRSTPQKELWNEFSSWGLFQVKMCRHNSLICTGLLRWRQLVIWVNCVGSLTFFNQLDGLKIKSAIGHNEAFQTKPIIYNIKKQVHSLF